MPADQNHQRDPIDAYADDIISWLTGWSARLDQELQQKLQQKNPDIIFSHGAVEELASGLRALADMVRHAQHSKLSKAIKPPPHMKETRSKPRASINND